MYRDSVLLNKKETSEALFLENVEKCTIQVGCVTMVMTMTAAPKLWNALPLNLRSIPDFNIFKRDLKTYLFRQAFY